MTFCFMCEKFYGCKIFTGKGYGPNVMFSDGENLGHVAAHRDVCTHISANYFSGYLN